MFFVSCKPCLESATGKPIKQLGSPPYTDSPAVVLKFKTLTLVKRRFPEAYQLGIRLSGNRTFGRFLERICAWRFAAYTYLAMEGLNVEASLPFFPHGFMEDLGAALQLQTWELENVVNAKEYDLPSLESAWETVLTGIEYVLDPTTEKPVFGALTARVLRFCLDHLADHEGIDIPCDILVRDTITTSILDSLSEFLWQFRHLGAIA